MKSIYKSEEGKNLILNRYQEILDTWPVVNEQRIVETTYGDTFVIESGQENEQKLIMIHGSASNSYCWYGDIKRLSEKFHVFCIDIIGEASFSDENRPEYNSGSYAKWLNDVIGGLGISQVSIVGLSLGAWMAMDFATTYPGKVKSLFMISPGGLHPMRISFLFKIMFYSILGEYGKNKIIEIVNGGKVDIVNEGVKKAYDFMKIINSNFNPRMGELPVFDGERLKKLNMPVYVVYGDHDKLLNAEKSISYMKEHVNHMEGVLLVDTGHVVVDQADAIIDFIEA